MNSYIENQQFDGIDFNKEPLVKVNYEACIFRNCNLAELDLGGATFIECQFEGCDVSMAKLKNVSFREVKFISCKLLGLHFNECNSLLLSFTFRECIINFSSFYRLKLKGCIFDNCHLQEVDFTETDLANSNFINSNLQDATFENTILIGADLCTAKNYSIDPEKNNIKKARFSLDGIAGLLDKYDIKIY